MPDEDATLITRYKQTGLVTLGKAKELTAIIELRPQFDEEANIDLANRLHKAGAHVAYGVVGYKTRQQLAVRRDGRTLRRHLHLGTGNYHQSTPRLYCAGADWMDRNLLQRVETCFPTENPTCVIQQGLQALLADKTQSWVMKSDGGYQRMSHGRAKPRSALADLLNKVT